MRNHDRERHRRRQAPRLAAEARPDGARRPHDGGPGAAAREAEPKTDETLTKRQRRRRTASNPAQDVQPDRGLLAAADAKNAGKGRRHKRSRKGAGPSLQRRDADGGAQSASRDDTRPPRSAAAASGVPALPMPLDVDMPPRLDAATRRGARTTSDADATGGDGARLSSAYAALDLGTNNCRLLIATPTRPGRFRVIDAFSRIVRLGEGLGRTGRLGTGAMDRAVAALAICGQKLAAREIAGSRLIATEACRAAANGEEFIERVERETGLRLEIVSRETEARLAVSGCGSLIDRGAKGAVLFDIGGGSTEIALLDLRHTNPRRLSNAIVSWTSLPVGVVSLAERYGGRNVPPQLFEAMVEDVLYRIGTFGGRDRLGRLVGTDAFHLLGTSGTVTTLAGIHLRLERYDRRQVDGLWLTDAEVDSLIEEIAGWSFEERVANPCIGSDRADLVIAGCAILEAIRRVWPAPALRVADRGLREGLLTEMMAADGVWRRGAPDRAQAAYA